MKKLLLTFLLPLAALAAEDAKRDPSVVKKYIRACVGDETLKTIQKHEGGKAFLSKFFTDTDWMEQFAGSGMWEIKPWNFFRMFSRTVSGFSRKNLISIIGFFSSCHSPPSVWYSSSAVGPR